MPERRVVDINDNTSKNAVLAISIVTSFLTPFTGSSLNVALPSIGEEFSMDALSLGWVVSSYLLSAAVFLVPMGRIADIHGRKRVLLFGMVIFTFFSLLLSLSNSPQALIVLRILQGIGSAMMFGTGVAILTSVFPARERGKALGINVASVYLGLSLGPSLGGILTQHFGWRSIFLLNVPLGLVVIILVLWKLKGEWAEAKKEKINLPGSIVYGVTLIALMYGLSLIPDFSATWFILLGLASLFVFVRLEARAAYPIFDVSLFRHNLVFALSNVAALINYSATFAVGFLLSLYLQYTKGLSPQAAGLVLVSQPIIMSIVSPVAGRLSDRIEPRVIASIGMAITSIGLLLLAFLGADSTLGYVVAVLLVIGLGFGFFSSPNTNAVMSSVERKCYGVASATLGTMRLVGNMLSMGIVMLLFSLYIGRVEITPEFYPLFLQSMRVAFVAFAALCFLGIFASLARGRLQ